MPEPFKNLITRELLQQVASDIQSVYEPFQIDGFLNAVFDDSWEDLELKARVRHISVQLAGFLPKNYPDAIGVLDQVVANYGSWLDGFAWFFPDFVETHGQADEHWDISVAALERYTRYSSSELAVRPFIIRDEARMMQQMYEWARHEDELIRRLASEGSRPQLPWAMAIPSFKADPTPVLPILEQLKDDPSETVRRSVANNLNDISKTHPELVAKIATEWYGKSKNTDWIVKHACRTLLKQGNREVLGIFGYDDGDSISVSSLSASAASILCGEDLVFSFTVSTSAATKVRLEYGIDYVKANGKTSRKIFQLSELTMKADETRNYDRKQSFADMSTRKHYPGTHTITLIVNGVERGSVSFELLAG